MSPKDDDQIGHVPTLTPAQDEIASFQRNQSRSSLASSLGEVPEVKAHSSGVSTLMVIVIVVMLLATAAWAGYLYQKIQVSEQVLKNYELRISQLERQLSVTDESMSESGVAMKIKLRELDSEVRKLWDNVWKKSKATLDAHDAQLNKQAQRINTNEAFITNAKQLMSKNDSVVASLSAQLKKAERTQVQVVTNQNALKRIENSAENSADKTNRVASDLLKLDKRVRANEEWVDSINGFRRQVNRDINSLKQNLTPGQGVSN
jgi:hypothetical protein